MSFGLFHFQSIIILIIIYFGLYIRKQRTKHVKTMLLAIALDLVLILQIEISRKAVIQAIKPSNNPLILNIHLFFAIGSVILYCLIILSGRKLIMGQNQLRGLHKKIGFCTVIFRTLTSLTSFFVEI